MKIFILTLYIKLFETNYIFTLQEINQSKQNALFHDITHLTYRATQKNAYPTIPMYCDKC